MRAGRLILLSFTLAAVGLTSGGCQRLDPFRQGILTTYNQELRQLAEDVDRKELAKITKADDKPEEREEAAPDAVMQANHWDSTPLLNAVRLQPPVAFDPDPPF